MVIYSHSRLAAFEQCPRRFKFRYIDKLEPEIKDFIEGFLGNKVHEVLEWVYNNNNNNNNNNKNISLDEIIRKYAMLWNKDYYSGIKINKSEFDSEHYFNKGIKFLIDYFLKFSPFRDNTIATEKRIVIDLNNNGKYVIQGYIDRLVYHKDSNIFEIHDYKTSSSIKTQEELDKDRQLALYSLGIRKLFDNVSEVHLVWHFLNFNKKLTSKRTEEQLENLKKEIINLIDCIESAKEFPANPGPLCGWCEFKNHCKKNNTSFCSNNSEKGENNY